MQFLKKSYYDDMGQLIHDAPELSEADIEDAMAFQDEPVPDSDDMMVDSPPNDDDEIEAMFASYKEQQQPVHSPAPSDDYEDIFAELIAQEQKHGNQPASSGDQMEIEGEDNAMSF